MPSAPQGLNAEAADANSQGANTPFHGTLLRWAGAKTLAVAAEALAQHGFVILLADAGAQALPPPLPDETTHCVRSQHPGGYLVRRGIARALAATVLGGTADDHPLHQDAAGAPKLHNEALHLSFSARNDTGVIAMGRAPLGVDYEPALPPAGIPWNLLRPDERAALEALPPAQQAQAFLALWRTKEATLKALGLGFVLPPEAVHIAGERASVEGYPQYFRLVQWPGEAVTLAITPL